MDITLHYESDRGMDIHDDVKVPYHMLGHDNNEYGVDTKYENTSPSPGPSTSVYQNLNDYNLIGHEDQSSIGLRRRHARLRQEEENRLERMGCGGGGMYQFVGTRPKRVLQNWERVNCFATAAAAEESLSTYQQCRWMRGNKNNTKEGRKEYYSCREGTACPAMIHLLYDAKSPKVYMFQNDSEHVHIGERKRGIPAQIEKIVRKLYNSGTRKPSQIQSYITKKGLKEIQKSQLANFLQKLKREAGDTEQESESFFMEGTEGGANFQESWLGSADSGPENQQDSLSSLGHIAPLAFASAEYNFPSRESSTSVEPVSNAVLNFTGLTPVHTLQQEKPASNIQTTAGNQSEIVSSSCGKKFYCRDESTEEGEHCLPNEENIKELILQHLRVNYSNRDMLHIRDELRTLKKEKKYPVLNRLVSFTAGFLQDTFMEDHECKLKFG